MKRALITLYNPSKENLQNLTKISEQVDYFYICDNSSKRNCIPEMKNAFYIFTGENLGISKAFNNVFNNKQYHFDNDDFVIFFDQDSVISAGHINKLIEEWNRIAASCEIGCLGPIYTNPLDSKLKIQKHKKALIPDCYEVKTIITSSMLTKYGLIKEINFFDENLFLDLTDWDLCFRIKKNNKMVCITERVLFEHRNGLLRRKGHGMIYDVPIREYYQIKGSIYLLKKRTTPLLYKFRFLLIIFIRCPMHILLLDSKKQRAKYIIRAIRDSRKKCLPKEI